MFLSGGDFIWRIFSCMAVLVETGVGWRTESAINKARASKISQFRFALIQLCLSGPQTIIEDCDYLQERLMMPTGYLTSNRSESSKHQSPGKRGWENVWEKLKSKTQVLGGWGGSGWQFNHNIVCITSPEWHWLTGILWQRDSIMGKLQDCRLVIGCSPGKCCQG